METLIYIGTGCYRVVWFQNRRMIKLCEKMLCGLPVNHRSGHYRYALFCMGLGFVMKRKDCSVPACEQTWSDVCQVEHVS